MAKRVVFNLAHAKRAVGVGAKVLEVEHPPRRLPPCHHCGKKQLYVSVEYVQEGMFQTDFVMVLYCKVCSRPTIMVYVSEDESNV